MMANCNSFSCFEQLGKEGHSRRVSTWALNAGSPLTISNHLLILWEIGEGEVAMGT
jgi:hypothetical protein